MKLSKLTVENFRAIERIEIDVYNFTSLIGPNNSAKSSILRAIEILLAQKKPELEDWPSRNTETEIVISAVFSDISEEERDLPGIAAVVHGNKVHIKMVASFVEGKVKTEYQAFTREEQIEGWSETWGQLDQRIKDIAEDVGITGGTWRQVANKERVRQLIRERHPEWIQLGDEGWTDEGISIDAALRQGIPHVEVVPAVRDAMDESKQTQRRNILAEILASEILPEIKNTQEYSEIERNAENLSRRMRSADEDKLERSSAIANDLSNSARDFIDLTILFKIEPPDLDGFFGKSARINLFDGVETSVGLQGHGAQRALIYALVRYIAEKRATTEARRRSCVLLFEEPELFVHPHLLRKLKKALINLSRNEGWQVIISTHSPVMVNVAEEPRSLILLARDAANRVVSKQLREDPFAGDDGELDDRSILRATLDFHPTVTEAFFAKRAVLVEGDTEKALFSFQDAVVERLNLNRQLASETTIISCGGKWPIIPMAKILRAFQIDCKAIHDEDRKGRTTEELNHSEPIDAYRANARIADSMGAENTYVVSDTLEDLLFGSGQGGKSDKPYRAWRKVNDMINNGELTPDSRISELFVFAFS